MSPSLELYNPPQGAFARSDGTVRWCVWAPSSSRVLLVTRPEGNRAAVEMTPREFGFFEHSGPGDDGLRYAYLLDHGQERPDPASRWQPGGVHRPSAVFNSSDFAWSDDDWGGVERADLAIYELHVGTFTPEGTFAAAIPRLIDLKELGVTAVEIMPVSQFPGERNWGYDGVHPFAVQNSYGGPRELQRLVDVAHRVGLGVILDVVYNHLGPEGNYLGEFGPYFTDRYHTPWGKALNYDGPDSEPVRRFVCDNARMWIRDFHVDGLRLDAVQTIYDTGPEHILAEIQESVQEEAATAGRPVHVIAETHQNDMRLVNPADRGGYGLDAMWTDDFHHAAHSLLSGERHGYYADFALPEHLATAFNNVFVYDGRYSQWRRRRHGTPAGDADRSHFVIYVKNHDSVGNRPRGDRPATYLSPAAQRLWCALLLLHPAVPLIFMGEEYGETHPFPFFCSFDDAHTIRNVRRGRREYFAYCQAKGKMPDPQAAATYESAKLHWSWPDDSRQHGLRRLYQDLLSARRDWPALRERQHTTARVESAAVWVIERGDVGKILACANLTSHTMEPPDLGDSARRLLMTTEAAEYGGSRSSDADVTIMQPHELLIYGGS